MAKLTGCEYSLVLYLMNCVASGLEQVVSTELELSSLLDYEEVDIIGAIRKLHEKGIIQVHYSDKKEHEHQSLAIGLNLDMKKWKTTISGIVLQTTLN